MQNNTCNVCHRDAHPMLNLSPERIQSLVISSLYLMDYEVIADRKTCLTQFNAVQLGSIDVFQYDGYGSRRSYRQQHHILSDKVEDYVIGVPLHGSIDILQDGVLSKVFPGQFAIMTTATPFQASISAVGGKDLFSCYQARISGAQMRARVPCVDEDCNLPIRIRSGAGSIMQSLFELSLRDGSSLPQSQVQQLGTMLLDMVANSVLGAPELEMQHAHSRQSPQMRIVEKAKVFIEAQLSNPDLGIALIADHCHVSVRTLQTAFASSSMTIAVFIQERRLQHCHSALTNPLLRDKSVTQIAMSWGFNSLSYFSRVYKERFSIAPRENRLAH